jgi:hypothetical protein
MPADHHSDMSRDAVSLTYQELADRLGIDVQSARRRALRSRWPKAPGNDGRARVLVPAAVLPAAAAIVPATDATRLPPVAPAEAPPAAAVPATPEALSHLLSRVAEAGELRERLGRLEAEAEALRVAASRERERADRGEARAAEAERRFETERLRVAMAEREREEARVQAAAAEARAEELQVSIARETARAARAEAARRATEDELAGWVAGGPIARAWRALVYRRGRP